MNFTFLKNRKGSVSTAWIASLPVFVILFLFVGSVAGAWMTRSSTQIAADAGSLAATKELNKAVLNDLNVLLGNLPINQLTTADKEKLIEKLKEKLPQDSKLRKRLLNGDSIDDLTVTEKLDGLFKNQAQKIAFLQQVVALHHDDIVSAVREYVQRNKGRGPGTITFPVNGRVEVTARMPYKPLILENQFKDSYTEETGRGPELEYLKLFPEKMFQFKY